MREVAIIPNVTLVGYQGVKRYDASRDRAIFTYFMDLAKSMTRGERKVPDFYRRVRGGEEFPSGSLKDADRVYKFVADFEWREGYMLKRFFEEGMLGVKICALVGELFDGGMAEELQVWIRRPVVKEEDIERGVVSGGLEEV